MTTAAGESTSITGLDVFTEGRMGAQPNIKYAEAYRRAWELAAPTGERPTAALRERLERERRARIGALAAEIGAGIHGPVSSADHNALYGPDGLPT